jgi:mRNA-degrading endonuclease RelE of RelBE toxin-antitoxin system
MLVSFVETPGFSKRLPARMDDDEYRAFQNFLAADPLVGDVIKDTGGVRKVRWSDPTRSKGKRGGVRVIYYFFREDGDVVLLAVYSKDQTVDLSAYDRKVIREYVAAESRARAEAREALRKKREAKR